MLRNDEDGAAQSRGHELRRRRSSTQVAAANRTKKLALHLFSFIAIFIVTWTMDTILVCMLAAGQTVPFWVVCCDVVLANFAGVWNALAYRSMLTAMGSR